MISRKLIIGIVVLVIISVSVVGVFVLKSDTVESSWGDDGTWGQQMILQYEDGTKENMLFNPILSLWNNGKEVKYIHYILKTKKTTNDGTLDYTDFSYKIEMENNGETIIESVFTPFTMGWNDEYPADDWSNMIYSEDSLPPEPVDDFLRPLIPEDEAGWVFEIDGDDMSSWTNIRDPMFNELKTFKVGPLYEYGGESEWQYPAIYDIESNNGWNDHLHLFVLSYELMPYDFVRGLDGDREYTSTGFDDYMWQYSSTLHNGITPEDFCQATGIYPYITKIVERVKSGDDYIDGGIWIKGGSSTLDSIEPKGPYRFYVTQDCNLQIELDLLPLGDYKITLTPSGTIKYNGESVDLPVELNFAVSKQSDLLMIYPN